MQIAQPEMLCIVNDDRVCIRNIETALHDVRTYEHIIPALDEVNHFLFEDVTFQLTVSHSDVNFGTEFSDHAGDFANVFYSVMNEENLTAAIHFKLYCFFYFIRIENNHLRFNRLPI